MNRGEKIKAILEMCQMIDAVYQVQYDDYEPDEYTVPVKLTPERIKAITDDFSVCEIKITIKP